MTIPESVYREVELHIAHIRGLGCGGEVVIRVVPGMGPGKTGKADLRLEFKVVSNRPGEGVPETKAGRVP
jgi:hypothetical protein